MDNFEITTSPQAQNDNGVPQRRFSRRLAGGLAAAVVVGLLSVSVAQARGFGGGGGGGFMAFRMHKMLDKVNATEQQRAQIKAIWEGLRPQLKATREQHGQLRKQITQAMTAATIDPAAIEKLRQQSVQLMDKSSTIMTRGFVESARVLTPEQRKQLAAELEKNAAEHHHGHGDHGEGEGAGAF